MTFMRYLLLIIAVSSLGFAADPEATAILDKYAEGRVAWQKQCVADLVKHRSSNYLLMKAVALSDDPKESEKKAAVLINSYNGNITYFDRLAAGQMQDDVLYLMGRTLGDMKEAKAFLLKSGLLTAASVAIPEPAAAIEAPKPKEKKKITAVLGDGTKIE